MWTSSRVVVTREVIPTQTKAMRERRTSCGRGETDSKGSGSAMLTLPRNKSYCIPRCMMGQDDLCPRDLVMPLDHYNGIIR